MSSNDGVGLAGSRVFTRASSGLVREVSTLDTMYYGMMQIGIPYIIFIIASWLFYPGASMELSTLITIVGGIFLGITYALYSAIYPRSGGEYVFLSRSVHPAYGFLVSFYQVFWQSFYAGITGAFWAIYGWSPLFSTLGLQTGQHWMLSLGTWFGSHNGIFVTGFVMILFFGTVLYRGVRRIFLLQRWAVTLALISVAVLLVILGLAAAGAIDFQAKFNALAGAGAYNKVISTATAAGTNVAPGFSFAHTLTFMVWPAFSILFAINSVSFSGEVKNVRRGQLFGITGAMVLAGVIMAAMMFFLRLGVGSKFLLASSAVGSKFPLAIPPWINLLASIAGGNVALTVLCNLYVLLLIPFAGVAGMIYASRALLAWGLDGAGPEKFADVSPKFHSPRVGVAISVGIALVALILYAYTGLLAVLSGLLGFSVAFGLTALAAITFPYRKKDMYEGSPAAMKVAGVPLMTISAIISSVMLLWVIYRAAVDKVFAADNNFSLILNGIVFAAGPVWYLVLRWYRLRQGVDLNARYKEMPVE
jgi:amino acid transporter